MSFILSGHTIVNASGKPSVFTFEMRLCKETVRCVYRKSYQLCGYTESEGGSRVAVGQQAQEERQLWSKGEQGQPGTLLVHL